MKMVALAWLLFAGNIWADVKRFDLNGEGALTIAVPQSIRVQFALAEGGQPAHLTLSNTNRTSEMHMALARNLTKLSDEQMKSQLLTAGQQLMTAVVEKEIKVQELKGNTFTYFYFELTDNRPDPPRYVLRGLGRSSGYTCEFVMLTNQKNGEARDQILNALRSLGIRMKK